jgi:hypothetical protein
MTFCTNHNTLCSRKSVSRKALTFSLNLFYLALFSCQSSSKYDVYMNNQVREKNEDIYHESHFETNWTNSLVHVYNGLLNDIPMIFAYTCLCFHLKTYESLLNISENTTTIKGNEYGRILLQCKKNHLWKQNKPDQKVQPQQQNTV